VIFRSNPSDAFSPNKELVQTGSLFHFLAFRKKKLFVFNRFIITFTIPGVEKYTLQTQNCPLKENFPPAKICPLKQPSLHYLCRLQNEI
jgi:hypothetical protein